MVSKSKRSEKENDAGIVKDMDTQEQVARKKAEKKVKKQAKRDKNAAADADADTTKTSRKRKSVHEEEAEAKSKKKHKKSKKDVTEPAVADINEEKKSKKDTDESEKDNSDDEKAARKEKKRLKKEKKAAAALREAEDITAKKADSEKSKDKSSKKARQPKPAAQPVASADQWNPDALTGDAARKNKFLRLLGAGKGAGIEAAPKKQQASDKDIQRVESDLERQFAAGIRMKHGGIGKRTGLGM